MNRDVYTEDLLLATRIPVFTKRAKRKTVAHPKFYFFDVGVYRALRPMGPFDLPEEAEGPALESLVLQELQAINHYFEYNYEIYTHRDSRIGFSLRRLFLKFFTCSSLRVYEHCSSSQSKNLRASL